MLGNSIFIPKNVSKLTVAMFLVIKTAGFVEIFIKKPCGGFLVKLAP